VIAWPDGLISAVARRRSVLLIGSGVSANSATDDGRRPSTWGAFLTAAYKKLGKRLPYISSSLKSYNYLEACDYLRSEHGEEWPNIVRAEFATPLYRPADIHKAIFDLDSRIIASLNFDKIYDNYANLASEGTIIVKTYYDPDMRDAVSGADRYIIKPHGTVDTVSKMIFTLEQYGKARTEYASFYDVFSSLLHTHTFICVGCGLADPDLQLIFEDYRYKHGESPHFITLPSPVSEAQRNLIKRTRGLNVLTYSPRDNHADLTKSLQDLVSQVSLKRDEIADLRSW
jgi:SIR2-like domain